MIRLKTGVNLKGVTPFSKDNNKQNQSTHESRMVSINFFQGLPSNKFQFADVFQM